MSTEVNASELITHRFGLDGIQEAIRFLLAADTSLKTVIYPAKSNFQNRVRG
jgi:threonine dehydrogenase-like Zn-dependent dehydrogenase